MMTVLLAGDDDVPIAEPCPAAAKSRDIAQLVSNVEQAISDAAATLMRAEQEHEAALTATRAAEAEVEEAQQVLDRLERLRDRMTGADVPAGQQV